MKFELKPDIYFVGIGVVAKDYDYLEDDNVVECYLRSLIPEVTGNPIDIEEIKKDANNTFNTPDTYELEKRNTIKAVWFQNCFNRVSCPHVRVGDIVKVYQLGNSKAYYWEPWLASTDLHKRERIEWRFAARPGRVEADPVILEEETAYNFTIDTYDKQVHFHTTRADLDKLELTRWDFQLDTLKGIFTIVNDFTDEIQIDGDIHDFNISMRHNIDILNDHDIRVANGNNQYWWNKENITLKNGIEYSPVYITGDDNKKGVFFSRRNDTMDTRTKDLIAPKVRPQEAGNIDIENGNDILLLNHNDMVLYNGNNTYYSNQFDFTFRNGVDFPPKQVIDEPKPAESPMLEDHENNPHANGKADEHEGNPHMTRNKDIQWVKVIPLKAGNIDIENGNNIYLINHNDMKTANGHNIELYNADTIIIHNGAKHLEKPNHKNEEPDKHELKIQDIDPEETQWKKVGTILIENGVLIHLKNGVDIKIDNGNNIEIRNKNDITVKNDHDIEVKNKNDIRVINKNNISVENDKDTNIKNKQNIDIKNDKRFDIVTNGMKVQSAGLELYTLLQSCCSMCASEHPADASFWMSMKDNFKKMFDGN